MRGESPQDRAEREGCGVFLAIVGCAATYPAEGSLVTSWDTS